MRAGWDQTVFMTKGKFAPFVSSEGTRELTWRAVALILLMSCALATSNAYLGLYIGLTVSTSISSSVIAASLLRPFGTTPQEINLIQTGSSAGTLIATGLIFTLPALVILGYWEDVHWLESSLIASIGGFLGVLIGVPLRRAFVILEPLEYPEGVACADVINATLPPESTFGSDEYLVQQTRNRKSLLLLGMGIFVGMFMKLGCSSLYLWKTQVDWAVWVGTSFSLFFGLTISPAIASMGYIVGWRSALNLLFGAVLCWWVFTPLVMAWEHEYSSDSDALESAIGTWSAHTRFIGIGALLLGSIVVILTLAAPIIRSFRESIRTYLRYREQELHTRPLVDQDLPLSLRVVCFLIALVPLLFVLQELSQMWSASLLSVFFSVFFGCVFSFVVAWMAGSGIATNPILGATVTSVIASSIVFLLLLGRDSELGSLLAILVGAVICCIVSVSGESMQDYKTGLILGNTPFKQQIAQLIGILLPSVTLPLVLSLIIQAYGIGKPSPEFPVPLMAPQANLIADVSRAIFFGTTPKWMICWGLAMAVVLLLIDFGLKVIGSSFRLKVLSVALGMYLPFENSITMSMGSLTGVLTFQFLQWYYPNNMPYVRKNVRFGMMFAAGVICGESITGILFAIPVAVSRDLYVLSVSGGPATNALLGMILLFLTLALHSLVIIYPALFSRYQDEVVEEDERPLVMLPRVHN